MSDPLPMRRGTYVTHEEFTQALHGVKASHDELARKVDATPAAVVAKVKEDRAADRRRFWRNLFYLSIGVMTILGGLAAVVTLLLQLKVL